MKKRYGQLIKEILDTGRYVDCVRLWPFDEDLIALKQVVSNVHMHKMS